MPKDDSVFNTKLVEAVQRNPCLYNYNLKEYSNRDIVNATWERVATEMVDTVKDCKETWRNLRIVFARNLRKAPGGSRARHKQYYLLEKMQFLRPYLNIKMDKSLPVKYPSSTHTDREHKPYEPEFAVRPEESCDEEFSQNIGYKELNQQTGYEEGDQSAESAKCGHSVNTECCSRHCAACWKEGNRKCEKRDVDQYVINYIKSKKESQIDNYRRQFLVSLLPDVEEMNANQFRQFRKRVGDLIEEILEPNSSTPQTATTPTTWTNESSASSFGINI